MKIQDASLTINSKSKNGQNNALNILDPSQIELEMDDELNRQQFEEENPYCESQKLNMTDYQQRNLSKQSRGYKVRSSNSSQKREERHRRKNKTSPFEKYEQIKFTCYELQQKIIAMNQLMGGLTQQISDSDSQNINF